MSKTIQSRGMVLGGGLEVQKELLELMVNVLAQVQYPTPGDIKKMVLICREQIANLRMPNLSEAVTKATQLHELFDGLKNLSDMVPEAGFRHETLGGGRIVSKIEMFWRDRQTNAGAWLRVDWALTLEASFSWDAGTRSIESNPFCPLEGLVEWVDQHPLSRLVDGKG